MPPVVNKKTGERFVVTDDAAGRLVASGEYDIAPGESIAVRSPTGAVTRVGQEQLSTQSGLTPVTAEEWGERARQEQLDNEYGGLGGGLKAFGGGLVRGLSFGLNSPWQEAQDYHPYVSGAGEIVGMIAPAIATEGATLPESAEALGAEGAVRGVTALDEAVAGGAAATGAETGGSAAARLLGYTPAGMAAQGGRAIARVAGGGIRGAIAEGATVGAMQSAGGYLGQVANGDTELSAQGFLGAMGQGALWGGAGGGVFEGVGRGFTSARNFFPELAGRGAGEAEAAEQEFLASTEGALDDGDDLYAKAKQRMTELRVQNAEVDAAARKKVADVKVAEAEHRLAARQELDDLRVARAKRGRAKPAAAPPPEVPAAANDPIAHEAGLADTTAAAHAPGVPSAWTPEALADSGQLAEMLGQTHAAAKDVAEQMTQAAVTERDAAVKQAIAEHDALADATDEFAKRRNDVEEWVRKTRAKGAGGKAGMRDAAGSDVYSHNWRNRGAELHDAAGNVVSRDEFLAMRPDEAVAWDRPHLATHEDTADLYEDYNAILRRAAIEPEGAARDALVKQAAVLEEQGFDASVAQGHEIGAAQHVREARARLGLSAEDLARQRLGRHEAAIASMKSPEDVLRYVEGTTGTPNLAIDVDEAARILGEYERAQAKLAEAAGPVTPPAAAQRAQEFRQAQGEVDRKISARHAQVADEVASEPPPEARPLERSAGSPSGPRQPARRAARAASKPAPAEGAPAARVDARARAKGLLRHATDLGQLIEVLHTLGVPGVPDLHKIPVIGPLLSLYLKAKVARRMLGKLGGKVGATVEGEVASRASATRDRIARSIDGLLAGSARTIAKAKPAAGALGALAHKLYEDGQGSSGSKDPRVQARDRVRELASAVADPTSVRLAVRRALRGAVDPDLVDAIELATLRKLSYLASNAPKEPPPSLLGTAEWLPSLADAERFARRVRAAEDPASVLEDAARGTVTPEGAETLRAVYPRLYQEAQERLIDRASEREPGRVGLPMRQLALLSVVFGVPLAPAFRPESQAAIQAAHQSVAMSQPSSAGATASPPPGGAADLSTLYLSASDRRAMRR